MKRQGCSDTLARLFPSDANLAKWTSDALARNQKVLQIAQKLPEAVGKLGFVVAVFVIEIGKMLLGPLWM